MCVILLFFRSQSCEVSVWQDSVILFKQKQRRFPADWMVSFTAGTFSGSGQSRTGRKRPQGCWVLWPAVSDRGGCRWPVWKHWWTGRHCWDRQHSYKTTLKQQLNGQKRWKMRLRANPLSFCCRCCCCCCWAVSSAWKNVGVTFNQTDDDPWYHTAWDSVRLMMTCDITLPEIQSEGWWYA